MDQFKEHELEDVVAIKSKIFIQGCNRRDMLTFVANTIKAKHACEGIRKDFVVSRSFPIAKIYDPTFIEPESFSLISCYLQVAQKPNHDEICKEKLKRLVDCLDGNMKKDFPSQCVQSLESYMLS